jgi:hypothetical protein
MFDTSASPSKKRTWREGGRTLTNCLNSNPFSLFRRYKFPVLTLAVIHQKCPRVGHISTETTADEARFREFPCIFPC